MTEVFPVTGRMRDDAPIMRKAAQVLARGGLVAFPTETVYGLGANGLDPQAVRRIFAAKGRPADNPLILHLPSFREVLDLIREPPAVLPRLAAAFWPGPLTLVLLRQAWVPEIVSAGLPTVAVRVPAHPVALNLINTAALPLAAPSANTSGRPSPTLAAHVMQDLEGKVDLILDGGPALIGLESTVLDLTHKVPRLLRPGGVTVEELRLVLGREGLETVADQVERPASPGMKYTHYAPHAPLTIIQGSQEAVKAAMFRRLSAAKAEGKLLGALVHSESLSGLSGLGVILDLGPSGQPRIAAERLFGLLRACDEAKVDAILAEAESEDGMGLAVMNRLLKAAGGRSISAGEVV